jgi:hypothetical protein
MAHPRRNTPRKRRGVEIWMPGFGKLGYSRREAEQVVRIVERLWARYTARGLTIDSPDSTPTALEPFEVLVQAMWHFRVRRLFHDLPIRH